MIDFEKRFNEMKAEHRRDRRKSLVFIWLYISGFIFTAMLLANYIISGLEGGCPNGIAHCLGGAVKSFQEGMK